MGTVTEKMKIFLVTVALSLTILRKNCGAPGKHLLIETDADDEGGPAPPPVGAARIHEMLEEPLIDPMDVLMERDRNIIMQFKNCSKTVQGVLKNCAVPVHH